MTHEELSAEDKELLKLKLPAELEKEAQEKVAQMQEFYGVGFEKMASDTAEAFDKIAEEEEEDEGEESDADKKLDGEHKKEASVRGAFIARGFVDGLMKQGSERHQDPFHYLYPALEEKLAGMGFVKDVGAKMKGMGGKVMEHLRSAGSKMKAHGARAVEAVKKAPGEAKRVVKEHPKATAGSAAAGAALGYGAGRFHQKHKDK